MEERTNPGREEQCPNEVVESYRPGNYREVVAVYRRPLPVGPSSPSAPPKRRSRKGLWVFLALMAAAAVAAGAAWAVHIWQDQKEEPDYSFSESFSDEELTVEIPTYPIGEGVTLEVTRNREQELTPQEIYARVNPAVVTVMAGLEDGSASVGTGVIFREDGYILTNYHVVEGGRDCVIMLHNNFTFTVRYVAGDRESDLAILKCDMEGMPTAVFGDSDQLTVGDPVYAIGNPLGMELRGTFTNGIVSAIDRSVEIDGKHMNLIQTNAALNSGNSGGPLIDQYGRVVGINVIKMTGGGRHSATVEGLGFAIPSASAERIVNDLLTYGALQPEPKLGMSVLQINEQLEEDLWGIEVAEVLPDSAAARAGMQEGDFIIAAGEEEILTSQDLFRVRRRYHIGDTMAITVWRQGERIELLLELQEPFE